MHRNLMRKFRLYMLIGGMPQAIEAYLEHNNLQIVDETKREIVELYEEDFTKIDGTGLAGDIYDAIPASLSKNASRYVLSKAREGVRANHSTISVVRALNDAEQR
jgi:predicted AAA+ superfamily ATPase